MFKSEEELITEKLAYVRDNIFNDSDFVSDEGYDMTGSFVGSPYEVLCGMETKLLRQQKEIEQIKGAYKDREDDIEFYWSQFHEIERIRLNPDTSDDEKWEKIGELISSILVINEFD